MLTDAQGEELQGFKDNIVCEQENAAAAWALQQLESGEEPGVCIPKPLQWGMQQSGCCSGCLAEHAKMAVLVMLSPLCYHLECSIEARAAYHIAVVVMRPCLLLGSTQTRWPGCQASQVVHVGCGS